MHVDGEVGDLLIVWNQVCGRVHAERSARVLQFALGNTGNQHPANPLDFAVAVNPFVVRQVGTTRAAATVEEEKVSGTFS